ncbi:MAG: cysteine peptidase family C39 domain-containing protein [Acidobacteriota bacterium]
MSSRSSVRARPRRSIPLQAQTSIADCGAACLAMVLGFWRKHVPLAAVREAVGAAQGADGLNILEAGRSFGLVSQGVQVERLETLAELPRATILHWRFNHFGSIGRAPRND